MGDDVLKTYMVSLSAKEKKGEDFYLLVSELFMLEDKWEVCM